MHAHLVAAAAWRWRNQNAPTDGLLKRVASEDLILVSSGGSDWLKSAGTAVRTEGGYLINARKIFSSGGPAGDLLVTSAVYEDPDEGATVLHFAVPMRAEASRSSILGTSWAFAGLVRAIPSSGTCLSPTPRSPAGVRKANGTCCFMLSA
jgi:acyl-CoA dehydrogenase